MDLDAFQQNFNTRVVFKEPRGMIRWIQLLFAIIAVSTVTDFSSQVGITITCPQVDNKNATTVLSEALNITYPFDFSGQTLENSCNSTSILKYKHFFSLNGSPQFFVMTGVLSLIYCLASLVIYLLFSSTYHSISMLPVADLTISCLLGLFWFIGSVTFGFGVYLLKNTVTYELIEQTLCQTSPKPTCARLGDGEKPSWNSLDVALVCGFTSFFIWAAGLWFVFKETHYHTPRVTLGPNSI